MSTLPGKFITIEGSEGVGKSTNIAFIKDLFEQQGVDLLVSREPGGTPLAEDIRHLLLATRSESMDETAELLLVFAARAQHLREVIVPAINRGSWVLCDRFTDSTYAYQGGGRGLSQDTIAQLETLVQQQLQPDLTLYLDIDVRQGLARAQARAQPDRFEREQIDFFERVRAAYLARVQTTPARYKVIDAGQGLAQVQQAISSVLLPLFNSAQTR